jgi:hypothetical protein
VAGGGLVLPVEATMDDVAIERNGVNAALERATASIDSVERGERQAELRRQWGINARLEPAASIGQPKKALIWKFGQSLAR